jgi:2-polyprenyl-6-methoxyphenol hydroxylase-like FAD-dependent oxidoreductase
MATRQPVDVVVVGARTAGAATALLLARAGLSVTLLDRDRPGTDTLSTHALMRGGVLQLHRWGLLDAIVAAGTPAIRHTTFRYRDSEVTVEIRPGGGVDALRAPRRTVLDPVLVDAARQAGADVRHGSTVTDVLRGAGAGRVVGVKTTSRDGTSDELPAALVVGADGRRSTIARLVGAPVTHRCEHTSSFVYGYFRDLAATGYEWAYRREGTAGFIPTNDGLTCVFGGHLPAVVGRGGADVLQRVVAAASPAMGERLRAASPASHVRTFTGQPGQLRRGWGPGWALVGDAGSWKDPITAHGLTDALRDAELLARAVLAVASGTQAAAEAFGDYERLRDHLTLPILRAGDEIAAMAWDQPRLDALLGDLNRAIKEEVATIAGLGPAPAQAVSAALSW